MTTKFISRPEEFIFLAVRRLEPDATGVTIQDRLRETTGKTWAYGAFFIMLRRLENMGI